MKSYLRFLSRNKLYTAIEVVGLSIALAFVIVLSSYIVDDMSVNKELKNTENIYMCHKENSVTSYDLTPMLYDMIPDIEESCAFVTSLGGGKLMFSGVTCARHADKEAHVSTMAGGSNLFDFFTFPLIAGDTDKVLADKGSIVISENLANTLFPEGNALGKEINLSETNALKGFYPEFQDMDVNLIVTGVFKPISKTVFYEPDIIIHIDMYHELQEEMYHGMLSLYDFSFVRIRNGADIEAISQQLTDEYRKHAKETYGPQYDASRAEVRLTAFDQIKTMSPDEAEDIHSFFCNIRNGKLFGIYLIICIFLTVVALLDYVVLTIAFSRFRIKEIATRQLLGTDRRGIIGRCFLEAFMLLMVSCIFAVLIAVAFREPVGQILGSEINPLSHFNEYLILAGIILIMVGLASAVPSFILSSYSAINVIKGEVRYNDKTWFGKLFISIAGLLSIGALAVCFGITRQTRHLINQPLGYETDGVILIRFMDKGLNRYHDELKAQSFVSKVGRFSSIPNSANATIIGSNDGQRAEIRLLDGDRDYFEILGIEFIEEFSAPSGMENYYMCQSTYDAAVGFTENRMLTTAMGPMPLCGIVSDLKLGNLNEETAGKYAGVNILNDFSGTMGEMLCVKAEGNEKEALKRVKEFYRSKGYNDDICEIGTLKGSLENEIREERNIMKLLTGFSIICILMTIMTIVGLSSYHSKTNERSNAVRNVFGCSKQEMIRKLTLDFTLPVVISAIVAIPAAYMVIGRWIEGYVIRTDNSPIIYIGAFAVVLAVTIASVVLQAIRLMRTNPADALKKE